MGVDVMKQHGMLFADRLMLSLLDGSKTQTRRPVDLKHVLSPAQKKIGFEACDDPNKFRRSLLVKGVPRLTVPSRHPDDGSVPWDGCGGESLYSPWSVGDLIWCRETWAPDDDLESYWGGIEAFPEDAQTWESMKFRATACDFELKTTKWRPSIHMPKWACRCWKEITDVRVQRIQEISEEDAKAEGVPFCEKCDKPYSGQWGRGAIDDELSNAAGGRPWRDCYGICQGRTYKEEFRDNWNSIYPGSWERNDWVWALTFKPAEPPQ